MDLSLKQQVKVAANDSLGLCAFGQSVTNTNLDFLTDAINAAHGANLTPAFFEELGRLTLPTSVSSIARPASPPPMTSCRHSSIRKPLPPTDHVARFHGADVHSIYDGLEVAQAA
jgi:aldehyde:ferredoxin oxidoreductase